MLIPGDPIVNGAWGRFHFEFLLLAIYKLPRVFYVLNNVSKLERKLLEDRKKNRINLMFSWVWRLRRACVMFGSFLNPCWLRKSRFVPRNQRRFLQSETTCQIRKAVEWYDLGRKESVFYDSNLNPAESHSLLVTSKYALPSSITSNLNYLFYSFL